jgi:hypothetical protein
MKVSYCVKCKQYYYTSRRKYCIKCSQFLTILPINFNEFTNMDYDEREKFINNCYRLINSDNESFHNRG